MAQDPEEAEHDSMPLTAIGTGMVDWVLPVGQMPAKLVEFVRNENRLQLPPETAGPKSTILSFSLASSGVYGLPAFQSI